jgi:hypothetical protein
MKAGIFFARKAGINPDRVLQSTTKTIMGKFNERFHPADHTRPRDN